MLNFAFFNPRGQQIKMHKLCFVDVNYMVNTFPKYVHQLLVKKIKIDPAFNMILLPGILRQVIPEINEMQL